MNNLNFINPVPPRKEREVRVWFSSTLVLFCAIIVAVSSLHFVQLRMLKKITLEKKSLLNKVQDFDAALEAQHKLKQEEEALTKRLHDISEQTNNPKNPVEYLTTIAQACAREVEIQSLKIENEGLEIAAQCTNQQEATRFIEKLADSSYFKDLTLTSLNTSAKKNTEKELIDFRIQGRITS